MADLARIPRGTSFLAKAISNDYVMQVLRVRTPTLPRLMDTVKM